MLWWFVGALTLLPLLTGHAPDYATARAGTLLGSFVGHVVYGAIVGALYALVDGAWIWLFERTDPLAREARGPGTLVAGSLARGAVASLGGGLIFSLVMAATGELTQVARLVVAHPPRSGSSFISRSRRSSAPRTVCSSTMRRPTTRARSVGAPRTARSGGSSAR